MNNLSKQIIALSADEYLTHEQCKEELSSIMEWCVSPPTLDKPKRPDPNTYARFQSKWKDMYESKYGSISIFNNLTYVDSNGFKYVFEETLFMMHYFEDDPLVGYVVMRPISPALAGIVCKINEFHDYFKPLSPV